METGKPINRRIALIVQYDGTAYHGWQYQENARTVQEELERSLRILTKENVRITASGRTDAGVHALYQVVHFDTSTSIPLKRLVIGMNGILDSDLSIRNAFDVAGNFHARYDAIEREYLYLLYTHPQRTPFMRYRAMWLHEGIDAEYMKNVAAYIIGEKDFASFCKKQSAEENTVRRILDIAITEEHEYIAFRIRGTAFLHNMIRIIIGTTIEMYREKRKPEEILDILESKDRDASGFTAPPYGLYLLNVKYNPPLQSYPAAFDETGCPGQFFI